MAKSLSMKEIANFDKGAAAKRLSEIKEDLQNLRFKVAANDLKNVRAIRALKQSIARLSTYLSKK